MSKAFLDEIRNNPDLFIQWLEESFRHVGISGYMAIDDILDELADNLESCC